MQLGIKNWVSGEKYYHSASTVKCILVEIVWMIP